jgi:hypothetical protein
MTWKQLITPLTEDKYIKDLEQINLNNQKGLEFTEDIKRRQGRWND